MNTEYHNRTTHMDICHHFVHEEIPSDEVIVIYFPTGDMIADTMKNWQICKEWMMLYNGYY